MRAIFAALFLLLAAPALADDWQRYENTTYGYTLDIPPGLLWRGEGGNGDGQAFTTPTVTLMVQGLPAPAGFEAAIRKWRDWESRMGWNLVFEMTTPSAASASARRSGWLMEMRAITICGDAVALLQIEYGTVEAVTMKPTIERLARSLRATRRC